VPAAHLHGRSLRHRQRAAGHTGSQGLTDDEFQASFNAPSPGSYVYVYRFSPDGQRWTYCDPNGAGSAPAAPFEPNSLPALTVTP
jgi:hypothetical protein